MKKLIWLPLAGFLLVAGAAAAAAAAAPGLLDAAAPAAASKPEAAPAAATVASDGTGIDGTGSDAQAHPGRSQGILDEVLAELVADGTISQAQADAIGEAVQVKAEQRRAEVRQRGQELREQMREKREQLRELDQKIRGFLADGVITHDEINQLPAEHPLRGIWNSIAEDGQVTPEQLRELRPHGGKGIGRGWGHGRFHQAQPAGSDSAEE